MEARRSGYRQQEAAPPERGQPLANLTRSMSQPASEPASAPALRHIPRRYLALGLIIVAICLLGALDPGARQRGAELHVDGGDLQPRAVVAPLHDHVGPQPRSTTPSA